MRFSRTIVIAACVWCFGAPAQKSPLQMTDAEKEEFLRTAEVQSWRELSTGITRSRRVTLSSGPLQHDAHWQDVDVRKPFERTESGIEVNFADSYVFNIAAYRLDRMLDLKMVPVAIQRELFGETGALTWWVDNVLMMEKDRYLKRIEPPDNDKWNSQMYRVRVFNELIYNTDANLGNVLITAGWQIRIIDFTRAFRPFKQIREKKNLEKIDRRLFEALQRLTLASMRERLADVLQQDELEATLARRDLIVQYFEEQARKRGESAVFY